MTKDISKLIALKLRRPRLVVLESGEGTEATATLPGPISDSQRATIELPLFLKEESISISKVEEKPLYLLKLLSSELDLPSDSLLEEKATKARNYTASNKVESSSETDSDSTISSSIFGSDSESSSSDDSRQIDRKSFLSPVVAASSTTHGILVFMNSNEGALRLARLLGILRPAWKNHITSLTKSTATSAGRKALAAFRKRKLSVLIASDRASRGLDIENLAHVVNYDMPTSLTSYVHRIGRTARAGKMGTATTLVAHHEGRWFTNEIAKSEAIHRASKVNRVVWQADVVSDTDRDAYGVALTKLGQEARGGKA